MPVTTAEIREIQAALSARDPVFVNQESANITTPNGIPSGSAAGVSVLVSSGEPAIFSVLKVRKGASVTSYDLKWWLYDGTDWTAPDGGAFTGLTDSWSQLIPTGPVQRVYCEITAITDGGSDGVMPVIGPCDPAGA